MRSRSATVVVVVAALLSVACRAAEAAPGSPAPGPLGPGGPAAGSAKGAPPPGLAPAAVVDDVKAPFSPGPALPGFSRPLHVTHAGDGSGRLFVVEQTGLIRVVKDGKIQATPFFDARALLGSDRGEQGLLGLAFHPRFKENGRLFIAYTDKGDDDAVAELRLKGRETNGNDVVDPASLSVLFAIEDPAGNHNGGHLLFGPDGKLWIGTGDGGGGGDPWKTAQDPSSLLGKMLRVDVDAATAAGRTPVIWSKGLRNPWRYAFDAKNGDLWVADVGQNAWEEVNVVADAKNQKDLDFGWSEMEGRVCFRGPCSATGRVVPPVVYGRSDGCSVTGGVVVDGFFVYGDYCTGKVWAARRVVEKGADQSGRVVVKVQQVFQVDRRISSFGVDEAGRPWLVDHGGALVPLR